jgi:hypothetical protein
MLCIGLRYYASNGIHLVGAPHLLITHSVVFGPKASHFMEITKSVPCLYQLDFRVHNVCSQFGVRLLVYFRYIHAIYVHHRPSICLSHIKSITTSSLNTTYKHTLNSNFRQSTFRNISHPKGNNYTTLRPSANCVPQIRSVHPIIRLCTMLLQLQKFTKFYIWEFYEKLLRQDNFHLAWTTLTATLHEGLRRSGCI